MAARADILALFEELASQLSAAGLPCSLRTLADVPARHPLSTHRLATFDGPPGRPLDALVFEAGSELRIGFRVRNPLTAETQHLHALLEHLTGSREFDRSTLDADTLAEHMSASAATLVAYLTDNARVLAVLDSRAWIGMPFDWGDYKQSGCRAGYQMRHHGRRAMGADGAAAAALARRSSRSRRNAA